MVTAVKSENGKVDAVKPLNRMAKKESSSEKTDDKAKVDVKAEGKPAAKASNTICSTLKTN